MGLFVIETEAAVAAGVRRIEALTGPAAFQHLLNQYTHVKEIGNLLKAKEPLKAVEKLIQEKQALEKKVAQLEAAQLQQLANQLAGSTIQDGTYSHIAQEVLVSSMDALKKLAYDLRLHADLVVLGANWGEKCGVAIALSDALAAHIDANQLIKQEVAAKIQGGGGGQKTIATAGGSKFEGFAGVVDALLTKLKEL